MTTPADAWVAEDPIPCEICGREACEDHLPSTLAALLTDIVTFVRRFVVLSDDQVRTVALWIAHTHVLEASASDCTPYLQVTSATKACGKTLLLEVAERLVHEPWLTGRVSAAALVRKIDEQRPTLLLDESDTAFNGDQVYAEALRGLLNSGYRRSGSATLCVPQGKKISFKDFKTFSAKAIAGIGALPDTIADRAIRIELKKRMPAETREQVIVVPVALDDQRSFNCTTTPAAILAVMERLLDSDDYVAALRRQHRFPCNRPGEDCSRSGCAGDY